MQSACIGGLMELAERDQNVLYLTADSGEGGLDRMFRRYFPERSFNFGIAEEHMVAAAAGMALSGKIPFVYTAAPFLAYRAFEFIRNDICLQNLPVKLIGTGSGLSVSSLGATHHSTEDIGVLRCLPNLKILSPATAKQTAACMKDAYYHPGPVYIRLGMHGAPEFMGDEKALPEHGYDILCEGGDIGILTTGEILEEVTAAADLLRQHGISATVVDVSVLKPFDTEVFHRQLSDIRTICTVEEHSICGGLGSIAAETIASAGLDKRLIRIGLHDRFSRGYGTLSQLRKENGLDAAAIAGAIREAYV